MVKDTMYFLKICYESNSIFTIYWDKINNNTLEYSQHHHSPILGIFVRPSPVPSPAHPQCRRLPRRPSLAPSLARSQECRSLIAAMEVEPWRQPPRVPLVSSQCAGQSSTLPRRSQRRLASSDVAPSYCSWQPGTGTLGKGVFCGPAQHEMYL